MNTIKFMKIPIKCLSLVGHKVKAGELLNGVEIIHVIGLILVASSFLPIFYYNLSCTNDVQLITENLCIAFTNFLSNVKIATFLAQKIKIIKIIRTLKDILKSGTETELQELQRVNNIAHRILQSYTMAGACSGYYFFFLPLVKNHYSKLTNGNSTRELSMYMKFPFDTSYSPIYELITFYTAVCIYIAVLYVAALDGTFLTITLNIGTYFKILRQNMEQHEFSESTRGNNYIKYFVNHHNTLCNITEEFRRIYSPIIFTSFLIASLQICVIVYQFVRNITNPVYMAVYAIFFFVIMLQMLMYCYGGELIKNETYNLSDSVYLSNWYKLPFEEQRCIAIILQRSQRNITMRVGFYDVTLESFMMIFKAAFSYVALVQSIAE